MSGTTEKDIITRKICEYVSVMKWEETKELGLNAQQVCKIKKGELIRFYAKTYERLKKYFKLK